jgi:hypothetical protein
MNRFVRRAAALLAAAVLFVTMAAAVGPSSAARAFEGVFVSLSVPAASPQRPTVTARVRFANLKAGYSRVCTLVWYQNGVPVRTDRDFTLTPGAVAECPVTTVFSAGTPKTAVIGCKLVSGSESVYTETDMELKNFSKRFYARLKASSDPYAISVVRSQNVVLVYALGEDGQHSVLQNAFLCSTGPGTPTGTYSLSDPVGNGLDRRGLFGGVVFPCRGGGPPGLPGGIRRLVHPSGGRFFPLVRKESEERHAKGKGFDTAPKLKYISIWERPAAPCCVLCFQHKTRPTRIHIKTGFLF